MINNFIKRTAILLLIGFLSIAVWGQKNQQPSPAPAATPFVGASVSDWKGSVNLQLPGQTASTPTRGQILPAETVISTNNGRLLLRLSDGSQVLLNSHTQIVLKDPARKDRWYLELLLGRIRAEIMKRLGGTPDFELGTPSAVIAVRGTRFTVDVDEHKTTKVHVFRGLVEVAGIGVAGPPVLLEPGFSTEVDQDEAPETPRRTEEIDQDSDFQGRDSHEPDSHEPDSHEPASPDQQLEKENTPPQSGNTERDSDPDPNAALTCAGEICAAFPWVSVGSKFSVCT